MACEIFVINLILQELTFISWHRVPGEKSSNMLSKPVIDVTVLFDEFLVGFIVFNGGCIIMCVCDVIMIRDVLIDGDSFVGENSYPYVMSKEKSINIDTLSDLYLAQTYINNAKNKL